MGKYMKNVMRKSSCLFILVIFVLAFAGCSGDTKWSFDINDAKQLKDENIEAYVPNDWVKISGEGYETDYGTSNIFTRALFDENDNEAARFAIDYVGNDFDTLEEMGFPLNDFEETDNTINGCDNVFTCERYSSFDDELGEDWSHKEYIVYVGEDIYYIYTGSNEEYRNDEAFQSMVDACNFKAIEKTNVNE